MLFDFAKLGEKDRYKILSFTVVPRPIAWVVTLSAAGQVNAAPFSFFNVMCSDPPIVTLGISASGGTARRFAE
jgi:flavin reductase (DIM6/NTAB) family NADH-FMN oxidoreductase RutF